METQSAVFVLAMDVALECMSALQASSLRETQFKFLQPSCILSSHRGFRPPLLSLSSLVVATGLKNNDCASLESGGGDERG
jgi:hypothetical protein